MNLKENGYPSFWQVIRRGFNPKRINTSIKCPMNYLVHYKVRSYQPKESTIPTEKFFVQYEDPNGYRGCRKVEELIKKYSFNLNQYNSASEEDVDGNYLLLREDFDQMIEDIRNTYISKNYRGLMSWLLMRAFSFKDSQGNSHKSVISKNRSLLLKVLYDVNPQQFLECFSNPIDAEEK